MSKLYQDTIRLAYTQPALREKLLPVIQAHAPRTAHKMTGDSEYQKGLTQGYVSIPAITDVSSANSFIHDMIYSGYDGIWNDLGSILFKKDVAYILDPNGVLKSRDIQELEDRIASRIVSPVTNFEGYGGPGPTAEDYKNARNTLVKIVPVQGRQAGYKVTINKAGRDLINSI
jgi:hypothetical protein